jgi:divalent metal cation (Fe/Co/Zn/Cd) transporter
LGKDTETGIRITVEIRHAAGHVGGVEEFAEVRARWSGHELHAELDVAVDPALSVTEGHEIAREVEHRLLHDLPHLGGIAVVHVDPPEESGERHHRAQGNNHDGLPVHSHR